MSKRGITVRVPQETRDALSEVIALRRLSRVVCLNALMLNADRVGFYKLRAERFGRPARLEVYPSADVVALAQQLDIDVVDLLLGGAMYAAYKEQVEQAEEQEARDG